MTVYYSTELYHHGIKGQKWGIRRYQNLDGTYTAEGKKRRLLDDTELKKYKKEKQSINKKYSNLDVMDKESKAKYDKLQEKTEYDRTDEENSYVKNYQREYLIKKGKMEISRNKEIQRAKKQYLSTKEGKMRTALTVGAAVVGSALAVYGTYKLSKFLVDQDTIANLNNDNFYNKNQKNYLDTIVSGLKDGSIKFNERDFGTGTTKESIISQYGHASDTKDILIKNTQDAINKLKKQHIFNYGDKVDYEKYSKSKMAAAKAVETGKELLTEGFKFVGDNAYNLLMFVLGINT